MRTSWLLALGLLACSQARFVEFEGKAASSSGSTSDGAADRDGEDLVREDSQRKLLQKGGGAADDGAADGAGGHGEDADGVDAYDGDGGTDATDGGAADSGSGGGAVDGVDAGDGMADGTDVGSADGGASTDGYDTSEGESSYCKGAKGAKQWLAGGIRYAGRCWYVSEAGSSCDDVCATHGGYNDATRDLAGSAGGDDACTALIEKADAKIKAQTAATSGAYWSSQDNLHGQLGCFITVIPLARGYIGRRGVGAATTAFDTDPARARICACGS